MKNGLINFLLLRGHDASVKQAIYDGVRRQAASGLAQVNTDTAVDRSSLIRVGYILLALVVAMAAYKILSPKDPFQSVVRVAAPWRTIARPSRTTIERVEPGNVEVYQGTPLAVTAVVRGLRDDERVELVYSTADGQMVEQTVGMSAADGSSQFACELSTGSTGIQQDLTYHLQAGDARTEPYRVMVKDAPSIHIQRVTYQYPSYTGLADQTVEEQGDLSALEGTRVKIEAIANQPIRSAYVELFDPSSEDPNEPVKSVPMIHEGESARGQITLALRTDRKTPMFSAFQLRFKNTEGQRNHQPARYQIEVTPDLPPLVEILSPRRREIELSANRPLFVEVRALDPDFALRRVRLHAVSGGLELLKHPMLDNEHQGQAILNYQLVPAQLGLSAGDLLVYWAEAEDNRRAVGSNAVEPNLRRTDNYRIRVIAPDEASTDTEDTNQDRSQSENDENSQPGEGDPSEASQGQGGTESSDSSENAENANQDSATAAESQQPGEADPSQQEDANGAQSDSASSSDSENNQPSETESGGDGTQQPQPASADSESETEGEQEAVASDGSNDGEAFERILEEMRKEQASERSESDPSMNEQQESDPAGADPKSNDPDGTDRQSADPNGQQRQETDPDASTQQKTDGVDQQQRGSEPSAAERPENDRPGTEPQGTEPQAPNDRAPNARAPNDRAPNAQRPTVPIRIARTPTGRRPTVRVTRPALPIATPVPNDGAAMHPIRPIRVVRTATPRRTTPRRTTPRTPATKIRATRAETTRTKTVKDRKDRIGRRRSREGMIVPIKSGPQTGRTPSNRVASPRVMTQQNDAADRDQQESPSSDAPGSGRSGTDQEGRDGADPQAADSAETGPQGDNPELDSDTSSEQQTGGRPADGSQETDSVDEEGGGGDDPNLEYTREATDLALDYLKDRQDDRDMLERLGWTPDEVQGFLRRWQQMRQNAQQQGVRGRQSRSELEDRLKGLGLRPPGAQTRRVAPQDGVLQSSDASRSEPPTEYRDQFRAFQKSFRRALGEK